MKDDTASIYPIAIFIVCLGLISLAILIGSEILDPFFNLMAINCLAIWFSNVYVNSINIHLTNGNAKR